MAPKSGTHRAEAGYHDIMHSHTNSCMASLPLTRSSDWQPGRRRRSGSQAGQLCHIQPRHSDTHTHTHIQTHARAHNVCSDVVLNKCLARLFTRQAPPPPSFSSSCSSAHTSSSRQIDHRKSIETVSAASAVLYSIVVYGTCVTASVYMQQGRQYGHGHLSPCVSRCVYVCRIIYVMLLCSALGGLEKFLPRQGAALYVNKMRIEPLKEVVRFCTDDWAWSLSTRSNFCQKWKDNKSRF